MVNSVVDQLGEEHIWRVLGFLGEDSSTSSTSSAAGNSECGHTERLESNADSSRGNVGRLIALTVKTVKTVKTVCQQCLQASVSLEMVAGTIKERVYTSMNPKYAPARAPKYCPRS